MTTETTAVLPSTASVQIEIITPHLAKDMLSTNVHNRTLRQGKVAGYARDMAMGNWSFNGDAIRFAYDGTLLDGQHRLAALVAADVTLPMLVVRGLAPEAQESMDIGARRNFGDALTLRGEMNAATIASIVRRVVLYKSGGSVRGGRYNPTHSEMSALLSENATLLNRASQVARASRGQVPAAAPSMIGTAFYLGAEKSRAAAETFYVDQLMGMTDLREGDPALALYRRLQNIAFATRKADQADVLCYCLQAWNHYRSGSRVSKLQAPHGGWPAAGPDVL